MCLFVCYLYLAVVLFSLVAWFRFSIVAVRILLSFYTGMECLGVNGFSVVQPGLAVRMGQRSMASPVGHVLYNAAEPTEEEIESALEKSKLSDEDVEKVGNLVADDEWMGLGMELSELVRVAVIEECKKNTADFIGKDEYKVGDITKEIDGRVKVSTIEINSGWLVVRSVER